MVAFPEIPNLNDIQIPAVFVDRFAVRTIAPNIRLAFGESMGDDIRYTSSIVMTIEAAQALSYRPKGG